MNLDSIISRVAKKIDKAFFDYGDLAKDEWNELVKEAQEEVGIFFDLENNEPVEQKKIAIETPEDEFPSAKDGKPVNEKARFKCEICNAGGDWQQSTYYFRCQYYDGGTPISTGTRFCLIPNKEQGNIHLVQSDKGDRTVGRYWGPQDSGKDIKRDFDAEKKMCWESLPEMLKSYIDAEREKRKKMAAEVSLGVDGLNKSWQVPFPPKVQCIHCGADARVGFVVHEGLSGDKRGPFVSWLHENRPDDNSLWLHDCCAVAVYFCTRCLETTSLYNQG